MAAVPVSAARRSRSRSVVRPLTPWETSGRTASSRALRAADARRREHGDRLGVQGRPPTQRAAQAGAGLLDQRVQHPAVTAAGLTCSSRVRAAGQHVGGADRPRRAAGRPVGHRYAAIATLAATAAPHALADLVTPDLWRTRCALTARIPVLAGPPNRPR